MSGSDVTIGITGKGERLPVDIGRVFVCLVVMTDDEVPAQMLSRRSPHASNGRWNRSSRSQIDERGHHVERHAHATMPVGGHRQLLPYRIISSRSIGPR